MLKLEMTLYNSCLAKKIRPILIGLIFLSSTNLILAQSETIDLKLIENVSSLSMVNFINEQPIIDGLLDPHLEDLKANTFNFIWQFDNPKTDTALVTYRMAYTPSHLYVYLETDVDSISYHRRGNLWGDGYKILLGIPQKDSLTNEYYELFFSPTQEKEYEWGRQGIMSYNIDQAAKKLSRDTKSQEKAQKNISGFEALIAWEDIKPYHPWFMDKMGFNIYFAKGIEHEEHGYITNGYSIVEDEGIWDEEIQKRNYKPIFFNKPNALKEQIILAQARRKNLSIGNPIEVMIASIGEKNANEVLEMQLLDLNARLIASKKFTIQINDHLEKNTIQMDIGKMSAGKYILNVQSTNDTITNDLIVILPTIDFQKIKKTIESNNKGLSKGALNTLQFELNQISDKVNELKVYETGEGIVQDWDSFQEKYSLMLEGIDPYEKLSEPYRRAFYSKYDATYQPYSIKLPINYDPKKSYPLLVFLHGSGRDEIGLLNRPRSGGNFIEIAPLARDIYRAYAEDYSQKDIIEAIDDVSTYFSVDRDNIIIGGFSMGGYGALRTYYENPSLYKGVAICAGHPNLANEWLDGEHPNFLEQKFLSSFSEVPIFIYHGKKDPAIDVKLIEEMSIELKKAGAVVTKSIVEEKGHEYPDDYTNQLYFDWLNSLIK